MTVHEASSLPATGNSTASRAESSPRPESCPEKRGIFDEPRSAGRPGSREPRSAGRKQPERSPGSRDSTREVGILPAEGRRLLRCGRDSLFPWGLLVVLFGLIVLSPLLQPGYFWGAHDARHDVYFIFEYDKSVQDGIWFPRWSPDWTFGYGYPFFIVYGPLATFVGELFHHFLGLGYEASVKAVLGLSIILSGLAMYGFVRSWLGRNAALVAAVAYMAIPYHLVDVFVRAAMAESVALIFLPLVLWGFRETVDRPRLWAVLGAAFAYAAIMWTSNLVALVFTPALGIYVLVLILWRGKEEGASLDAGDDVGATETTLTASQRLFGGLRRLVRLAVPPAIALGLGLGLSAAFFLPALVEQNYINRTQWFGQYYDPTQHFVYLHQLFNPAWGFGISQPGPDDVAQGSMSFQLGAAATVLALIALCAAAGVLPLRGRLGQGRRRELWFWGCWAVASVALTMAISAPLWRYVPLVAYAQFPWRYLMLAIIPLSILPAALVAGSTADLQAKSPSKERGTARALCGGEHPGSRPEKREIFDEPRGVARPGSGELERSAGSRDKQEALSWPAVILVGLLLLSSYPYLKVEMREPTPQQGPVSYAALMRFQRTSDEMTGVTAWVDPLQRPQWSPLADEWVAGREVTTRVDYGLVPQTETLAVNSEEMGSAHEQIYYYAKDPGQVIPFNRFWYPGWRAYLLDGKNGRPIRQLPVEREQGPLARVLVPVPAGEGYILLRFEDTPLRAVAKWITYGTLGLIAVMILTHLRLPFLDPVRRRISQWHGT